MAVQQGEIEAVARLLTSSGVHADGLISHRLTREPTTPARAPGAAADAAAGAGIPQVDLPFEVQIRDGAPQVQILHDQNVHQDSSLHFAAIGAHMDIAALLLNFGCSANHRNVQGHTPLHYAVRANNGELVRLLMAHGADPDLPTLSSRNTALHRAAALGCGAAVDGILDAKNCGIAADTTLRNDQGNTPAMEAASALETHCRRFDKFVGVADTPGRAVEAAEAPMTAGEELPAAEQRGSQRGYVYSRRRKRGQSSGASFQALCADPVALSARTAELRSIATRLSDAEDAVRRVVPERRLAWAKCLLAMASGLPPDQERPAASHKTAPGGKAAPGSPPSRGCCSSRPAVEDGAPEEDARSLLPPPGLDLDDDDDDDDGDAGSDPRSRSSRSNRRSSALGEIVVGLAARNLSPDLIEMIGVLISLKESWSVDRWLRYRPAQRQTQRGLVAPAVIFKQIPVRSVVS